MQGEEVADIPASLPAAEFLTAEELVSLRRPAEETAHPVIGEKLYTRTDSLLEEKALECALENYKDTLDKKRASKLCDLMQAEWNPESNIVTVSKLKGKFTQHMGRLINGKHVLAPEEAVFLLENNCIEILHNKIPMSTEEAFSMILKGNLALEKYEVYSHFSKLGFIVVRHQAEAGITEYEKEMNLHKYPVQKRHLKEPAEGEPKKKRLTFTGALSGDASEENSANVTESENNFVCPMEEASRPEENEEIIAEKNVDNITNVQPNADEQNDNGAFIDKTMEDTQQDVDMMNHTSMNDPVLEASLKNNESEISKETNASHDSMPFEGNGSVAETEKNTNTIGEDSQNFNELTENSKLQNGLSLQNNENRDLLDSNSQSSKFVDVMDVDTDAETSRSTSEVSRDNFDSNLNVTSQDSCISVSNDDNMIGDANHDSNFDVLSMSDSSLVDEEEVVLTIDAGSADNPSKEDDDDDDEVTLIEVTKKETKPLAVIDLSSDEEEAEAAEAVDVVDDDITVLEEYPSPSTSRPISSREVNSKKLNGCKKEEEGAVFTSSKLIPPLTIQFPDLYKKRVVCVARPPFHLLPNNVKPSKEAYVLNLKPKNSSFNNRVWNSYRDMQDYQRQRRQNRHQNNIPRDQSFSGSQTWHDRNSRNNDRLHRSGFGSDRVDSPDVNSNSRSHFAPPPLDFNKNSFPPNSFQNNFSLPNPATMNCELTIKENANESMVSSSSQSSHSNNFSFSSGIPNNALMNPMIPVNPSNFMAGYQRNAFSTSNVSHTHFMAELQRTCFTVATNVLSSMLNRNTPLLPNPPLSMFPPCHFNPNLSNGFSNPPSIPSNTEYYSMPHHTFGEQRRFPRGRSFPCRYRNVSNKRSWSEVRSAVRFSNDDSDDDDSDIEEMPIGPREIIWENREIRSLIKPGVRYPVAGVFKFVQITKAARVTNKYHYPERFLPSTSRLEIYFDVYPPGFTYKKTRPQIPKYRVVIVRATDPMPKYVDLVILQRKWNDGATLLIAMNDNGDISLQSFNSVAVPALTPHEI
ncbi:uncharacterized protein LOC129968635 [Argiope bruennichi]|uniref:tRNA-splicing endonuclease subunit Sen54 like protein n=1 Tax=Argiope bruennichi TaxID=94029 RepID=A0A8T0FLY9_ARGBR|nr:uncharacterized protein LOC129968635 [Argiope bruennichi]KAF8791926.1 tRNA-splicing endonuclease subunit Sen54 like protein [Argiope bruennichi]